MDEKNQNKIVVDKPIQNGPFKIFFIASHQSSLDDRLIYALRGGEKANLQKVISKVIRYKREPFSINVFCFDIIQEYLKEIDKDKEKNKYKASIKLQKKESFYKKDLIFEGTIFFKETQNNFIYDFKFEDTGFINRILPPEAIKFNKTEQLKLFNEALNKLKISQNHKPSIDLIMTSQKFLIGKKFTIDYFFGNYEILL